MIKKDRQIIYGLFLIIILLGFTAFLVYEHFSGPWQVEEINRKIEENRLKNNIHAEPGYYEKK